MALETSRKPKQIIEITPDRPKVADLQKHLAGHEKLVRAIEDELSDDELSDEQKLLHIAERVGQFMDGR